MKPLLCGLMAAGALAAQSVGGPVLGYVVDGEARMRPLYGSPSAAYIGEAVRDGVKETWGTLALLADGTALRNGIALEGKWASLDSGAFSDASGRELLIVPDTADPWRLTLPQQARAVRVSSNGDRAITLLSDESVALWSTGGKAEFRISAGAWWSIAFAGQRAMAYDPAEHALFWLDGPAGATLLRKLDGSGGSYSLAVDRAGNNAILVGEKALVVPLTGGDIRQFDVPEGAARLEALQGGRAFLLMRDTTKPIWLFDPGAVDPVLVIPALAPAVSDDKGGQQ
ncbi:MAG: hypothetical protein HYX27_06605 [Acidobacteria bacterium]|nr:hypothetical protein [Acidobacteriota bacterium]